jgi:leucyl-tRNA synthetase
MRTAKLNGTIEIDRSSEKDIARNVHEMTRVYTAFRQVENNNDETSSSDLGTLLRRVAEASTHEVETLIDELHRQRETLVSNGVRIQNDIARYAELNQGALAAIISDAVKKVPDAPSR